jgi:hypothetical protein
LKMFMRIKGKINYKKKNENKIQISERLFFNPIELTKKD